MEIIVTKAVEDSRLTSVSSIALALPEATGLTHGSHTQFLVRKKTFAYFLNDHHGDGIIGLACKVLPGDNNALVVRWDAAKNTWVPMSKLGGQPLPG